MRLGPEFAANEGQCIGEGGQWFRIPSRRLGGGRLAAVQLVRPQRDEREQAEEGWGSPCDCGVGPGALGLDAEASGVMPQGSGGHDLQSPFAPPVAARYVDAPPACFGICQAVGQVSLTRADDARPSDRARSAPHWWIEQARVQTQAGDHADPAAHCVERIDRRGAAVSDTDDLAIGQPSCCLQEQLPGSVRQLLVPSLTVAGASLAGCQRG